MDTLQRTASGGRVFTVDLGVARRGSRRLWALVALLLAVAIAATSFAVVRARSATVAYTTAPIRDGSLAQTVTASGTLNAQNTINVGTQASGTIAEIDADYNAHVKKGQVLARLDPTTLRAALDQAQAQLAQSEAQAQATGATASGGPSSVAVANANAAAAAASARAAQAGAAAQQQTIASAQAAVVKDRSAVALAQQQLSRDQGLLAQGYVAQNQVDTDRANAVSAQSTLDAAQSAVAQAQAQVAASQAQAAQAAAQQQAQSAQTGVASATAENQAAAHDASVAAIGVQRAMVETAKANLAHTVITSPVDGTVISRQVSVGQTVAASLQTPTLFAIAQDLSKMELDLAVGESDIGRVRPGDRVSFTVLAYPNRTFHGTVQQVRQSPTTTANVVTYTTVVLVDNKDEALRPGMTANATIQVAHVDDAEIVPLTAFSYQPPSGSITRGTHRRPQNATQSAPRGAAGSSSPWGATGASSGGAVTAGGRGRIFVLRGGKLVPVPVQIGLVGDTEASVTPLRGDFEDDDQIVVGDNRSTHATPGSGSPLGQQRGPGGGGYGRGGPMGGVR